MNIIIVIKNLNRVDEYIIDDNYIFINGKKRPIDKEKVDLLLRIIRTWEPSYYGNNIDAEEFTITVGEETITGKGKYPENYDVFKDWLGDLNDWVNFK